MDTGTLLVDDTRPGIAVVTLNRPERLNAMNHALVADLHAALDRLAGRRDLRVVVLTGAGRAFCAGLDLKEGAAPPDGDGHGTPQSAMAVQRHIATLVPRLRSMPVPVIAAVNGAASGGGMALALACDIRVAAAGARFNVAFVKVGLSGCDIGVSWLLPRLVGASRAFELMLTGRFVDAAEAERVGLVSRVVADGECLGAALEIAEEIAGNSPFGIRMTKEVMWSQLEVGSLTAGIDLENRTQILTSYTGDMREAVAAFVEKRPPRFEDR
ncbi:MAG: enoyl-CoA hydratase/isomerase family protein [Acidimicrobiia bacterium]|nr:enoyl-CoA hydratase/isomerase family protein [Acidimicrobiia bacterium]